MNISTLPQIIQGGMGVGVSDWRLARAVSMAGQLGVVSGTALDVVLARRLQQGDPGGLMLHALHHFPLQDVAQRIIARYYVRGGIAPEISYAGVPLPNHPLSRASMELLVAANFVEVFLAKDKQSGLVGINLLEKIQIPTLSALYGAMLAEVDVVLMGAGIPNRIPGALDAFAEGRSATLRLDVIDGNSHEQVEMHFSPQDFMGGEAPNLKRPLFLPIVSSATLAITLARKANGRVDGFVVEGHRAGGHNAPPRGGIQLNDRREPIYGVRDEPDLERLRALGLPFWLAGNYGAPGKLQEARALGAAGIQVGTLFAFCEESGITTELKTEILRRASGHQLDVFTNPLASPTGFPFKIVRTNGEKETDEGSTERKRRSCNVGLLRQAYRRPDGNIGYRCASEPVEEYVNKGGSIEDTHGRECICNGLLATIGLGQRIGNGQEEPPLVTAGDTLAEITNFMPMQECHFSASDVIELLLKPSDQPILQLSD